MIQRSSDDVEPYDGSFQSRIKNLQLKLRLKNMSDIAERFIVSANEIVEVGCGVLDENGKSFFTRSFPIDMTAKTYYCDCNLALAEAFPEIFCVEIQKLAQKFPQSTFDYVIGTNALDTLKEEYLREAFHALRQILTPNGTIIHCLNYEPYLYTILDEAIKQNEVAIPFFNSSGTHSIFFPSEQWNHPLYGILKKLTDDERQQLWQGLDSLDQNGYFFSLVQNLHQQGNIVSSFELYKGMYERVSAECGFKKVVDEFVSHEEIIQVHPEQGWGQRCITCGPDGIHSVIDDTLPEGRAKVILKTHVFCLLNFVYS